VAWDQGWCLKVTIVVMDTEPRPFGIIATSRHCVFIEHLCIQSVEVLRASLKAFQSSANKAKLV
jgi:hypothetical protein